jgi:hypothetical protein
LAETVEYLREPGESAAEFEQRVYANVPVSGPPGTGELFVWVVEFIPADDPLPQARTSENQKPNSSNDPPPEAA